MRIEQQNQRLESLQQGQNGTKSVLEMLQTAQTQSSGVIVDTGSRANGCASDGSFSVQIQDATYLNPAKEEKKTVGDELGQGASLDASDRKNQMAVLAGTVSEEDYAKMQEEGFSLDTTEVNTIVTVTDKIKMELAKAGKTFGDELSASEIEEMTGNAALASQLKQAFREADLPMTAENEKLGEEALEQAGTLQELSDGAVKYMLDNRLQPTIENLYLAQFSGSESYAAAKQDVSALGGQMERILSDMGREADAETMADCAWLVENGIPLTEENLSGYEDLRALQLPPDSTKTAEKIADAVASGGQPKDALLAAGYSLKEQAEYAKNIVDGATDGDIAYLVDHDMELTVENLAQAAQNRGQSDGGKQENASAQENYTERGLKLLTAQRQLEETRLAMTAEANYALLKRGVSIDTEPLAELVDELKNMESQYYVNLLSSQGAEASEENVALFAETTEKVQQLQQIPAYVLGVPEADVSTIRGAYDEGAKMKAALETAGRQYETLMTSPRADMGDSIQKAFQNVDDILSDLNLESTEENRRAVRILGYNGLNVTDESVLQMKAADEEVQRMFKNMTPAVVTQMIRQGVNPLDMKFSDLNRTAEEIASETGKDGDAKFSEYLYKLEKNHEITPEERSSYIGVFRLIHQVEQTDGAAVGALVHQGADLTMKNLLTAVRSARRSGKMEFSVDDDYGETEQFTRTGQSITEQLEAAYQTNCVKDASDALTPGALRQLMAQNPDWENMTPEKFAQALAQTENEDTQAERDYLREQMTQVQRAADASDEIYRILEQFDMPNTVQNVIAMESMAADRNRLFRQLFGEEGASRSSETVSGEDFEAVKEEVLAAFDDAAADPDALAAAQETLDAAAENIKKALSESDDVTSLDVREMRLMQTKLDISRAFAKKERYFVPVVIGGEVTNVSLKIVRGTDTKGIVDITMENGTTGKIAATFRAKDGGISGFIAADSADTRELLADRAGMFASAIQENDGESVDISVALEKNLDLNHFSGVAAAEETENSAQTDTSDDAYRVQTTRLYHIAEAFLRVAKEL